MNIKTFYLGIYGTNCYLTWSEDKIGYLFDCGGTDLEKIQKFTRENGITVKYLLLTHGHYDHIGGVGFFKNFFPEAELYICVDELVFLKNPSYNLSNLIDGSSFAYMEEVHPLHDGEMVGEFQVIATPGHTAGSVCYYDKETKMLISGDTMFKRSFGRTDFITGDTAALYASLKKLCDTLPGDTKVYSGHSDVTTIAEEKTFLTGMKII